MWHMCLVVLTETDQQPLDDIQTHIYHHPLCLASALPGLPFPWLSCSPRSLSSVAYNMEPMLGSSGWLAGAQPRFMALLPPAPAIRFRSEPRFPTNESLAEFGHHIITGLHDYSDTDEDKDLSTAFTTEPLARFNQHAINRAIQDLAKESALELARSLVPRLKARFEERIPNAKPDESSRKATIEKSVPAEQLRNNDPVKQPGNDQLGNVQPGKDQPGNDNPVEKFDRNSPEEKARFETSAVRHDISADTTSSITSSDYFLSDDLLVKDVPDQAGDIKTEVAAEFQIDSVLAKRVAQLALHDFIVLAGKRLRLCR